MRLSRLCLLCVLLAVVAGACVPPERLDSAMFVRLPATGWARGASVDLVPQYGDSTARYDLKLSVRYTTALQLSGITLVADLTGDSTAVVTRRLCRFDLIDRYGTPLGGGFGDVYQATVTLATGVSPREARHVVLWQLMDSVERLTGVTEVGVTAILNRK